MLKVKIKSSAEKRFKLTATGKIKRKRAYHNHILTKKENRRKRRLGQKTLVSPADLPTVRKMLCL
ncbi:MAG: 50S ribosomal protein L35 [Cytophagales bacterium]|nr:50S ribosomal protein L35 [Bernardetiaceae bacterium]MDW8211549.1 50S ribosomal protein L35 [Cytophagales bacterium]